MQGLSAEVRARAHASYFLPAILSDYATEPFSESPRIENLEGD